MCGIAGKLSYSERPEAETASQMAEEMTHRGPDAGNVYADGQIALGHRRLSILDLTEAGSQPMANEDGSIHIVFNGEIYNYRELREGLDHHTFRSETDTEVLLHLYEERGIDCLSALRGMFAFAIWDADNERLFLARDRLGQKPLYYRHDGGQFWFGSTIKAILADETVQAEPDLSALREFLTYSFVPGSRTGFDGIYELEPGSYMIVSEDDVTRDRYWRVSFADQSTAPPNILTDRLREKLREATRLRMRSDVPLGAFLSGGIDSSAVVGLMSEVAKEPVNTFSIGFSEDSYDELEFARAVADRHGTNHHEYTVTPDSMSVLPELIEHYESPFGDPSAIPTYYVSQMAAQEITVALGGDAGDENFAGYDRYRFDRITDRLNQIPRPLRKSGRVITEGLGDLTNIPFFDRAARALAIADGDEVERYLGFVYVGGTGPGDHLGPRVWTGPEADDEFRYLRVAFDRADGPIRLDHLMQVDLETYLPDDILVKVDRASMAHSLEVRSPFLDRGVVEFAASVPVTNKYRDGESKWLLKRATRDLLPDVVLNRSKQGFGVPVSEWFRGELREFCREKLERLGGREPFDAAALGAAFDAHINETDDHGGNLWNWVMLESWWERYLD